MDKTIFGCACGDFGHIVRFSLDPDDGMVYMDLCLNDRWPWWRRLVEGVRYILGAKRGYHDASYDSVILDPDDVCKLQAMLARSQVIVASPSTAGAPTSSPVAP